MSRLPKALLAASLGSIAFNLLLLVAFRPLVINPAMPLQALSVGPVVTLTLMGVIGATAVYWLLRLTLRSPVKPFAWVSLAVLLLSFIPDYEIIGVTSGRFAGGNAGSALVLMAMHVAAALVIVPSLTLIWGAREA